MASIKAISKSIEDESAKPQLTSLVDILTVLLIFLIKSFSAEGSPVNPVNAVTLPVSSCKNMAKEMTSIEITPRDLQVNGTPVASMLSVSESDSLCISPLYTALVKDKRTEFKGEMMIQADRNIEFEIVKKVMYTCSKAGATDFTILVVNED
jgi:biopolymer transport protein ExbD